MERIAIFFLSCALLLLSGGAASAQTILVLDDTASQTSAADAARRAGYGVIEARNVAGFLLELGRADADVIVLDLDQLAFSPTLVDAVEGHLADGRPAIVAFADLDAFPFAEALPRVACAGDRTSAPLQLSAGGSLSEGEDALPDIVPIATGQPADRCTPTESDAEVLATFIGGDDPAITRTRGGLLWWSQVSGVTLESAGDSTGDGVGDAEALFRNMLDDAVQLRSAGIVAVGDATFAEGWTTATGRTLTSVATPDDLTALIDADALIDGVFAELDVSDPGNLAWQAPLLAASAAGIPVMLSLEFLFESVDWTSALDVSAAERFSDRLVPAGPGLGGALFSTEALTFTDGARDVSTLSGAGRVPVAAFASGDPAALTWTEEPLIVIGGRLSALGESDLDADELGDAYGWAERALAWLEGQAPLALVVSQGTSAWSDAAQAEGFYPIEAPPTDAPAIIDTHPLGLISVAVESPAANWEEVALAAADAAGDDDIPLTMSLINATPIGAGLGALGLEELPETTLGDGFITPAATDLSLLFERPQPMPRGLALGVGSFTPIAPLTVADGPSGAAVAYIGDDPVITATLEARAWVLAMPVSSVLPADLDGDGAQDDTELLRAMVHAAVSPRESWITDGDSAASFRAAARAVGTRPMTRPLSELTDAPRESLFFASLVGDTEAAQPANVDALLELIALDRPLVLFSDALSGAATLSEALALNATRRASNDSLVEPFDVGSGVFRSPFLVPNPITASGAGTGASEALEPTDSAEVAIRYLFNAGDVAAVRSTSGTRFVNGFALGAYANADLDSNGLDDRVQLLVNQAVSVGRAPVPQLEAPLTIAEGTRVNVSAGGSFDPFGEELSAAWDLDDDGVYDDATGDLVVVDASDLDGPSSLRIGVEITNASGLRSYAQRDIDVVNVAPSLSIVSPLFVPQGSMLTATVSATDVAGDTLDAVWTFDDGVVLTGLEVMRTFDALGAYDATIVVSDDDGGVAEASFTAQYINVAPTLTLEIRGELLEGSPITFEAEGEDPGGDAFSVAWTFGDGASAEGLTSEHTYADQGTFVLTAIATDTLGADAAVTVPLVIENVPPTITSEPSLLAPAGFEYTYTVEATDPGDDPLTVTLVEGPPGMELDDATLRWTPGEGALTDALVLVRVSDGDGGEAEQAFTITLVLDDGDGGGAPDVCEARYGYDACDASDDTSDDDGDGLTLAEECARGIDPTVYSGPGVPELFAPRDGIGVNRAIVTLQFDETEDPDGDAVTYDVELAEDAEFVDVVFSATGVDDVRLGRIRLDVDAELEEDTLYTWRARAVSEDVVGAWSEATTFRVNRDNRPPAVPSLLDPVGVVRDEAPVFRWRNATDVDGDALRYQIELYEGDTLSEAPLASAEELDEAPTETTWTPEGVTLEEDATYLWRVRARDQTPPFRFGDWASATFEVDAINGAPAAPVLQLPIPGAELERDAEVELVWALVDDPDGDDVTYLGELASDAAFEDRLASFSAASIGDGVARWPVDVPLENGATYHWRVAASDGLQESPYSSAAFSLRGENLAPSSPVLEFPTAGATVTTEDGSVTLVVQNATDPNPRTTLTYEFVIAIDVGMSGQIARAADVEEGEGVTQVRFEDLSPDRYFWRARAYDGEAYGNWSSVAGFELLVAGDTADAGPDGGADAGDEGADAGGAGTDASGGGDADVDGGGGGGGGCATSAQRKPVHAAMVLLLCALAGRRRRT